MRKQRHTLRYAARGRKVSRGRGALETPELLAFDLLLRTASELDQQVGQLLRPVGVTPAQFNVLRILRAAGSAGLACSDISEQLVRHDPDVTRLLDRLEEKGWVVRSRDVNDRRVVTARITKEGLSVLDKLDASIEALHASQFDPLTQPELRQMVALLTTIQPKRR